MKEDTKRVKGSIYFFINDGKVCTETVDYSKEENNMEKVVSQDHDIYDLMSGKDFANNVEGGGFIDYDGFIADIFVDGYSSNLGIWSSGMHQGNFCLSLSDFKKMCDKHLIEVNWANK